jgi:hypothetical protein
LTRRWAWSDSSCFLGCFMVGFTGSHDGQYRQTAGVVNGQDLRPVRLEHSFPPSESLEFERDVVLNHHIGSAGQLNPGASIEGLLLGMGQSPIPDEYRDRQLLPTRLLVLDRRGRQYASHLKLYVCRRSRNRVEKGTRQPLLSGATRYITNT